MIYLIEYDRDLSKSVSIKKFDDSDLLLASKIKLNREIELINNSRIEVVILQGNSELIENISHRRYFSLSD